MHNSPKSTLRFVLKAGILPPCWEFFSDDLRTAGSVASSDSKAVGQPSRLLVRRAGVLRLLCFTGVARWLVRSWIWWSSWLGTGLRFARCPEGLCALL
jgi:hypothetical protein